MELEISYTEAITIVLAYVSCSSPEFSVSESAAHSNFVAAEV